MNFERNFKIILYKLFSRNNLNYVFGVLITILFLIILYNNNNLIEGNLVDSLNKKTKDIILLAGNEKNKKNDSMTNMNNKGNKLVYKMKETFVENMDCSSNNYFNIDSKNTASNLVNNACLQSKRVKQENKV
jgi:hypothetical protein